jgi:hypothetical protein
VIFGMRGVIFPRFYHPVSPENTWKYVCNLSNSYFKRNAYRKLVGKPERKKPLGRQRHRWVDNIKMDLGEIGFDGMDWIDPTQNGDQWRALVNMVMNLRVP